MPTNLQAGDKAPDFKAATTDGSMVGLKQFRGKWVILYFYPKDNTPGCTKQACAFRDATEDLSPLNAVVIGCSPDSEASHQKFSAKHNLPFILISDADHQVSELYGTWKEKSLYGRKFMGIERSTFLIDPKGKIAKIWRRVRVDKHIESILDALKAEQA